MSDRLSRRVTAGPDDERQEFRAVRMSPRATFVVNPSRILVACLVWGAVLIGILIEIFT
jgi:hypothetical protein